MSFSVQASVGILAMPGAANLFLQSFGALPHHGSVVMPQPLSASLYEPAVLDGANGQASFETLTSLAEQTAYWGQRLQGAWQTRSDGPGRPLLESSSGLWAIDQGELAKSIRGRSPGYRSHLVSKVGQFIELDTSDLNNGLELRVGWSGSGVKISQLVHLNSSGQASTIGYTFFFGEPAFDSLRHMMGVQAKSLRNLALELAHRIYISDQFTEAEWKGRPLVSATRGRYLAVRQNVDLWTVPESELGEAGDNIFLMSRRRNVRREVTGEELHMMSLTVDRTEKADDDNPVQSTPYLVLSVLRPSDRADPLMSLSPIMLRLWDLSAALVLQNSPFDLRHVPAGVIQGRNTR